MSFEEIKMPQLGESVTEGTIVKWLVSVGDWVEKYEPLAEIMTDKVTAEIPSTSSGIVKEIIVGEDETVSTDTVICVIDHNGKKDDDSYTNEGTDARSVTEETVETVPEQVQEVYKQNEQFRQKARYSPAVLKLSREHGIDLTEVKGSGAGGRITRKDLLKIIEGKSPLSGRPKTGETKEKEVKKVMEREEPVTHSFSGRENKTDSIIPVRGIRKAIAEQMVQSYSEIPHAWTMVEADVTGLVSFRNSIKEAFKNREGFNLTFFPFFVKAAARALKDFPQLNSTWNGNTIIQKKEINISVAVAAEDALYVPVIKAADEKTIKGIAAELAAFAEKAKKGTFSPEDMQGGTFTVNNTGSFGSIQSRGIINYPQAAILQVEKIVKRPIVINDMIAIRDMVNLCLSLDHRILDGVICGKFLQRIKEIVETISGENTSLY